MTVAGLLDTTCVENGVGGICELQCDELSNFIGVVKYICTKGATASSWMTTDACTSSKFCEEIIFTQQSALLIPPLAHLVPHRREYHKANLATNMFSNVMLPSTWEV